ncbi:hypothetical protein [Muricoccus pecuniae]|uniref:Uncharacterized protein n=1 Tax=Muricoccus pecuniae TaxID=693023 RepID=A0A840XWL2_9PROT|nr:hypothetical protein [Roseomonas pecuniae]MBB5693158.1 hypothetical protein [Roseomonas pecuniae]
MTRKLDAKPRTEWTEQETQSHEHARQESVALYRTAWEAATGGKVPLKKALPPAAQSAPDTQSEGYTYHDYDGAIFRRPASGGGVTDILHSSGTWKPYQGTNRTDPWMFGEKVSDPLAGRAQAGVPS